MSNQLTEAEKRIKKDIELEHNQYMEYLKTLSFDDVQRELCIITDQEYEKPARNFVDYKIKKLLEIIQDHKKYGYEKEFLYALLSEMEYEQMIIQKGESSEYHRIKQKYETYSDIISYIEAYKIKIAERKEMMKLRGFVFTS